MRKSMGRGAWGVGGNSRFSALANDSHEVLVEAALLARAPSPKPRVTLQ